MKFYLPMTSDRAPFAGNCIVSIVTSIVNNAISMLTYIFSSIEWFRLFAKWINRPWNVRTFKHMHLHLHFHRKWMNQKQERERIESRIKLNSFPIVANVLQHTCLLYFWIDKVYFVIFGWRALDSFSWWFVILVCVAFAAILFIIPSFQLPDLSTIAIFYCFISVWLILLFRFRFWYCFLFPTFIPSNSCIDKIECFLLSFNVSLWLICRLQFEVFSNIFSLLFVSVVC